jgi:MoaA/NifB/PqqE/SkfB family radical SAM enzyme
VGGCLAAGRGFVHLTAEGDVEPCPFVPYSDTNVREMSFRQALESPLLEKIRRHPDKLAVSPGGCCLWKERRWVESLLDHGRATNLDETG